MAVVIIIALLVIVASLLYIVVEQGKTIDKYEKELMKKARKNKNGTK